MEEFRRRNRAMEEFTISTQSDVRVHHYKTNICIASGGSGQNTSQISLVQLLLQRAII